MAPSRIDFLDWKNGEGAHCGGCSERRLIYTNYPLLRESAGDSERGLESPEGREDIPPGLEVYRGGALAWRQFQMGDGIGE